MRPMGLSPQAVLELGVVRLDRVLSLVTRVVVVEAGDKAGAVGKVRSR